MNHPASSPEPRGRGLDITQYTPTQQQILSHLPATPRELARAIYGLAGPAERNCIYVHISLLRQRLRGRWRIRSRFARRDPPLYQGGRIEYHLEEVGQRHTILDAETEAQCADRGPWRDCQ